MRLAYNAWIPVEFLIFSLKKFWQGKPVHKRTETGSGEERLQTYLDWVTKLLLEQNLREAGLNWADLIGVNLHQANLQRANLSGASLNRATANRDTIWPEGFNPTLAGVIIVGEDNS